MIMLDTMHAVPGRDDDGARLDAAAPRVSVVVAWPEDPELLDAALLARVPRAGPSVDTIVVTALPVSERVASAFPDIRFIVAPADSTISHMRMLGTRHAAGDVVLLVDDLVDDLTDEARSA